MPAQLPAYAPHAPPSSPRATAALAAIALCAALAGCKKPSDDRAAGSAALPGSGAPAGSAGAAAPAATDAAGTVAVLVGGERVAAIAPDQVAKWPRLDTLVPEPMRRLGTWIKIELVGATSTTIDRPGQRFPDMVPAVFPGEGGAPAFGMFDPVEHAKRGAPAMRADGLREIRLDLNAEGRGGDHQGGMSEDADPTKLVLKIKTAAGEQQLTGAQILALPRTAQPGSDTTRGWPLLQILEAAGVTKFDRLALVAGSGAGTLSIERREIDAKSVPFVKLNKQGELRVRVLKQAGTGWSVGGDLRGLTAIEVK
jgi:hypothetical protein